MPIFTNYSLVKTDDGTFTLALQPPINISGQSIEFNWMRRFDATPVKTISCASGYNGVSGLTVTNGAQGVLNVGYFHPYLSGVPYTNIAWTCVRTDSGFVTTYAEGYQIRTP